MPVEFRGCSFAYGWSWWRRPVLRDLDLDLPTGSTLLLGPNGAGKTTLLTLAASLTAPQRGTVCLGGLDTRYGADRLRYRRRVGWLPQTVRAVPGLRVREQVAYAGWLKGMDRATAWQAAQRALARVRLTDLADRSAAKISGGQLRRVGIAQALVHDADVLLLDEPAAGLDPLARRELRAVLDDLRTQQVSIVVSSHHTDDIDDRYDTVVVFDRGTVRLAGSVAQLLAHAPADTPADAPTAARAEEAYAQLITGGR